MERGRAAAESLMVDACTITRPGAGDPVFDPSTGGYTNPEPVTVHAGPCRVQVNAPDSTSEDFGGRSVTTSPLRVSVPMSVTGVRQQDLVTITAAALDPDLAGRTFRVEYAPAKTHMTARRLECEEVN
jgi:hypothetical protein